MRTLYYICNLNSLAAQKLSLLVATCENFFTHTVRVLCQGTTYKQYQDRRALLFIALISMIAHLVFIPPITVQNLLRTTFLKL